MTALAARERQALAHSVREAYMEIFPTPTIESRLDPLEPGSYVAVTCSPTRGVDVTLDLCERLALRGFKVVPHVAAKMVRDRKHLREIIARLNDLPIISIFVPGGDAAEPVGEFTTAYELLCEIDRIAHRFTEIGVAAHPEGHPVVDDAVLLGDLERKQSVANYLVTQMCFDADALGRWLREIRGRGIGLPAWLGLPGVAERAGLLRTSLRIGVGDSLRYLKRRGRIASQLLRRKEYRPDMLLFGLAPYIADPAYGVHGHHIYCFNAVEKTERWRQEFLGGLEQ